MATLQVNLDALLTVYSYTLSPLDEIEYLVGILKDKKGSTKEAEKNQPEDKESAMVRVLLAHQSGVLTGTFHRLPIEKQYDILSILLGRSRTNIKNAVTGLLNNSSKSPLNMPDVVEKVNNLITEKDLGLPLVGSKDRNDKV
ncbi:hypothetical protein [Nibrella viscosa]|uniref:hypothetical protein n=1 Tax=Nibrella viscosa TaxID=1084524 RepID=UPI0031EE29BA